MPLIYHRQEQVKGWATHVYNNLNFLAREFHAPPSPRRFAAPLPPPDSLDTTTVKLCGLDKGEEKVPRPLKYLI
jgi:hypothetical protein